MGEFNLITTRSTSRSQATEARELARSRAEERRARSIGELWTRGENSRERKVSGESMRITTLYINHNFTEYLVQIESNFS